jgi:hypothetical protein
MQDTELEGDADDEVDQGREEIVRSPVEPLEANDVRPQRAEPEQEGIQHEEVTVSQVSRHGKCHFVING